DVELAGCQYDSDPRLPWERTPTAPNSTHCQMTVRWENAVYPMVLDPIWSATTSMSALRRYHTATLLSTSPEKVFVAGGRDGSTYLSATEVLDTSTFTWSAGPSMTTTRCFHTAT